MPEFISLIRKIATPLILVVLFAIGLTLVASAIFSGSNERAIPSFQFAISVLPQLVGALALLALAGEIILATTNRKKAIQPRTIEAWLLLVLASAALTQGGFGPPLAIAAWFVARVLSAKWSPKGEPPSTESEK